MLSLCSYPTVVVQRVVLCQTHHEMKIKNDCGDDILMIGQCGLGMLTEMLVRMC